MTSPSANPSTSPSPNPDLGAAPQPPPRRTGTRHVGPIVAGSLTAGLIAAGALVAAPFVGTQENAVTGAVLLAFALGWALLAVLSTRLSDQPQRWAAAPAVFMALAGTVLLLAPDAVAHGVLGWVWPPALLALVVWIVLRARRQLHSRTRRWLLYPVLAVLAVASVGAGYETVQESVDAHAYPMPGQLVDVGGHRLHLHCTGSGSPTVVLEPGLGEISSMFGRIAPAVARDTRVCVYDRAGRGWSESTDGPQDGVQIATGLHTLLDRAHIPGPYVLAGHSFGGLYVRTFAARYPQQVAGLVLLDATTPTSTTLPTNAGSYNLLGRATTLLPTVSRLGGTRLVCHSSYGSLPPQSRDEERANCATARAARSTLDELSQSPTAMKQADALTDLAGKPLIVVTAGNSDTAWLSRQNDLARLSTNNLHRVIPNATHASLLESQSDAAASSQAIRDVIASVRTRTPLAKP
jgi:pimeloyl-ACP methyl ester carboxylesterase